MHTGGSSAGDAPVTSCNHARMRGSPIYGNVGVLQPRQICLARSPLLIANHPRSSAESCAIMPASCRAALASGYKVLDQSCARRLSGGGRFKMALRWPKAALTQEWEPIPEMMNPKIPTA